MLFAFFHVPVHVPRIDKILPLVPPDPGALWRTIGISAVARQAISPGSRTLYAVNMPSPRVRATLFTRQGRLTDDVTFLSHISRRWPRSGSMELPSTNEPDHRRGHHGRRYTGADRGAAGRRSEVKRACG